ncbi:hypothetical protein ACFYT3_07745 [Nocardia amikacinitolerans]|uniref:Uncharacterized protein n=1 Tax=Nocardia amikacinitolerans TaxID=756689 RepID=A0A285LRN2_9NOCA|nr:hypothetical protein [Nocardia amikacinitolerans]MCP2276457.1 hypothetical protein [Nocardia amikacinitolerans]MCP2295162.1 hypothetical protein [Nocardia amikacinitolerans]SNY87590.1 hypothetical protein SAMN04244553_4538 [Nocardia amikacinitolerans]
MDDTVRELLELHLHSPLPATPDRDLAHQIMRVHRECATDHCRRKDQALRSLIAEGRIVPDSSRTR